MKVPFSVYGIPLLGLGGLLLGLTRPDLTPHSVTAHSVTPHSLPGSRDITILVTPDPRQDKSMIIFLTQEARNVACCRRKNEPAALAQTIADYNLIAKECTPAVFQATHLPPAM